MEDLKKIQEFFSKPLEENVDKKYSDFLVALRDSGVTNMFGAAPYLQAEFGLDKREAREVLANWMRSFGESLNEVSGNIDIEDFIKVYQAIAQSGHPATVMLAPIFGKNEIEIIVGQDAPDPIIVGISNIMDDLGYKSGRDYSIAGDSSTLSRRQYSDIRRVNGGHKDYFEESVNEVKRPEPDYKQLVKLLIMAFKHEPKARFYFNRNNGVVYFDLIGGPAYSPKKSKMRDIFGGMNPIAVNREFGRAEHHEEETIKQVEQLSNGKIKAEIKELGNGVLYKLAAVNEATKDEETEFHTKLDKLVHDTFGKRKGEMEENRKLTFNDFVRMVRDDMMAGAAPDEKPSKELVGKRAKAYYNEYLQGASVDDLFETTKKEYNALLDKEHELTKAYSKDKTDANWKKLSDIRKKGKKLEKELEDQGLLETTMEEYNTGLYYDPSKEKYAVKAKQASKSGLEKVKDMLKKIMKEGDITIDDKTEFKLQLKHLLDKHVIQKEDLSDYEEKEADYDKLYSDYLYKMVKEVAAEKGYSKFLVSKDNPKGETSGLDTKTMNKILMNVIKDLDETIKLGKNLNEELCAKGKAYRKKRMAAGEKSSAYLNGRAVKVCKGQMKG
jgi:hypothetical protein